MSTSREKDPPHTSELIVSYTNSKLSELQNRALAGVSSARAELARLRRSIGSSAGSDPALWDVTFADCPAPLLGRFDDPSYAEQVIHDSFGLYALHQQAQSSPMHVARVGLGDAVRRLMSVDGTPDFESSPVLRRFNALATADSPQEITWHLRGIVTQLRGESIPLDYARLAADCFSYHFDRGRNQVRLKWGRQLYARRKANSTNTSTN